MFEMAVQVQKLIAPIYEKVLMVDIQAYLIPIQTNNFEALASTYGELQTLYKEILVMVHDF
jgi:hypothetical protein